MITPDYERGWEAKFDYSHGFTFTRKIRGVDDVSIIGLIIEVDIYSTVYMSAIFILISVKKTNKLVPFYYILSTICTTLIPYLNG